MKLHNDTKLFKEFIDNLNAKTGIDSDIIEKDYYVCTILRDLASKQDEYKAYFKGGTAVYKILNTMNRFSEDIDLTVKIIPEQTNNKNKTRLEKSASGYIISGLEFMNDEKINKKGTVTGLYRYNSVYNYTNNQLHKAGFIQVEATSFTVSEPYKKYKIEPLIYKLASDDEKYILKNKFDVCDFDILIITLERIFIDKIFAAEFYYTRKMYYDTSKHLYDIAILSREKCIDDLLKDKDKMNSLILCKRKEEKSRIGGIPEELEIRDFSFLKLNFSNELITEFYAMQSKYLLNENYRISIDYVKERLSIIINYFSA